MVSKYLVENYPLNIFCETQETFNTEELKLHIEQIGDLALISATVGLASSLTSLLHGLSQILLQPCSELISKLKVSSLYGAAARVPQSKHANWGTNHFWHGR